MSMEPDLPPVGWWLSADTTNRGLAGMIFTNGVMDAAINKTKDNPMINYDAQNVARDIITERKTDGLRERVTAAVATLTELFEGAGDGSVFSFAKQVNGRDYHYAAIKSGGKWYSTGSKTALAAADDDELITWLIGLEVYDRENILALATIDAPALIEGTATDVVD